MEYTRLIEQFLAGDEAGFAMLVKRYQNKVLNIVYSLLGQSGEAEDIAQEVFMKVYHGLRSFRKEAQFATWLYRICVNTTYNYIKAHKRFLPLEEAQTQDAFPKIAAHSLEAQETKELVNKAIAELPFHFRSVLVLKEIEGLSYKEIARTLSCRIGTVESRLFRARELLRKSLTPLLKTEVAHELR